MKFRPYQSEAIDGVFGAYNAGHHSALVVSPTGTGKTVIFGGLARRWINVVPKGRVLALAHREELVFQARDKMEAICEEPVEIEMGDFKAATRSLEGAGSRIFAGSIKTMISRLHKYSPHEPWLVIIDEAHHCVPKNKTYNEIVKHFQQCPDVFLVGVTATPDRTDEEALGQMFSTCAFEYEVVQAIDDGWLVQISQKMVIVDDLDVSQVSTRDGDLSAVEIDQIINTEKKLHEFVDPTIRIANGRPTLVFAPGVASAHAMAEIFNRHASANGDHRCAAVAIDGKTPKDERRGHIQRFRNGEFGVLIGCEVFTEGFDCEEVRCVAIARLTKSRSLYSQMIGRGTRPLKDAGIDQFSAAADRRGAIARSGKTHVDVIDFVGNSGRHKLIYTADILGGLESDEVVEKAKEIAKSRAARGEGEDTQTVMDDIIAAKEAVEADRRRRRREILASAKFRIQEVDPFDLMDVSPGREPGYLRGKPASANQRSFLISNGIRNVEGLTAHKASKLIQEIKDRKEKKLAMPRQLALLAAHDMAQDASISFDKAAEKIKELNERVREARPVVAKRGK